MFWSCATVDLHLLYWSTAPELQWDEVMIIYLQFLATWDGHKMSKHSVPILISSETGNGSSTGTGLQMLLWEALHRRQTRMVWITLCGHEVKLRRDYQIEMQQGSSEREEMMAELTFPVSRGPALWGGSHPQACLKQTPAPALSKHTPSVCKQGPIIKPRGNQMCEVILRQLALPGSKKGVRNHSSIVKSPQSNAHSSHRSPLRASRETFKFT
jgi:hypothetical protein